MRNQPALTYRLPHRTAGSFGSSPVGLVAEWITLSWLRFGVFLCWLVLLLFVTVRPLPAFDRALYLLVSPLVAVLLYAGVVLAAWIAYFLPGGGVLFGILRLAYLRVFSRLVVQEAPEIEMPLWRSTGRHP